MALESAGKSSGKALVVCGRWRLGRSRTGRILKNLCLIRRDRDSWPELRRRSARRARMACILPVIRSRRTVRRSKSESRPIR